MLPILAVKQILVTTIVFVMLERMPKTVLQTVAAVIVVVVALPLVKPVLVLVTVIILEVQGVIRTIINATTIIVVGAALQVGEEV
jgi:hypothetical protein